MVAATLGSFIEVGEIPTLTWCLCGHVGTFPLERL